MRVLVACEFSGIVREAFRKQGHDSWSCDLLESEIPGNHIIGDARIVAYQERWDLMIFHWPCTRMAVSGARWFKYHQDEQDQAVSDFIHMMNAPVKRIAGENPISVLSTRYRKPDQIIQPWQFGHGETKATCLWLKNLPKLTPTKIVEGRHARVHLEPPGPDRWKNRSRTCSGIADAFSIQWGKQ